MKLSPAMMECRDFMQKHGGKIHRHPGGFWSHETWNQHEGGINFGTATVEALISRGVAKYTRWKAGRRYPASSFPVEATLCDDQICPRTLRPCDLKEDGTCGSCGFTQEELREIRNPAQGEQDG